MKKTIAFLLGIWIVTLAVMPREAQAHRRYYRGGYSYYAPRYGFSFYYQRPNYGHFYNRPYYPHYDQSYPRSYSYGGYDYPRYDRYYWDDRRYCY